MRYIYLSFITELSVCMYRDDKDFNEAFKNLLCPIELLSKRNSYEQPLQYDLFKVHIIFRIKQVIKVPTLFNIACFYFTGIGFIFSLLEK